MIMHLLRTHIERVVSLTDEEFEVIAAAFRERTLKKGEYLLVRGNQCAGDAFLLSGSLMQSYDDAKGNTHVVQFAFANWWIADWDSILRKTPSVYDIRALETSLILEIDYARLNRLFKESPKIENYFRVIFQQGFAAQQRRIGWLQRPAHERYREFKAAYPDFEQKVSQAHIASFLGITRESLSRLKAKAYKTPGAASEKTG